MKKFIIVALLVVVFISLNACSSNSEIVGTWIYEVAEGVVISYTFNDDGSGVLRQLEDETGIKYKVQGERISITHYIDDKPELYTYTFTIEDNRLILKESGGVNLIFKKQ